MINHGEGEMGEVFTALVLVGLPVFTLGFFVGVKAERRIQRGHAVAAGAGRWEVHPGTGVTRFVYGVKG